MFLLYSSAEGARSFYRLLLVLRSCSERVTASVLITYEINLSAVTTSTIEWGASSDNWLTSVASINAQLFLLALLA